MSKLLPWNLALARTTSCCNRATAMLSAVYAVDVHVFVQLSVCVCVCVCLSHSGIV